jgi:hypothetical protein
LVYLLIEKVRQKRKGSFVTLVGWKDEVSVMPDHAKDQNGKTSAPAKVPSTWARSLPALLLRVGICQSMAAPIGFMSLRYISYPTMVLAKVST